LAVQHVTKSRWADAQ